jgi:hypothetical protein
MAIPLALSIGLQAAPAIIGGLSQLFGKQNKQARNMNNNLMGQMQGLNNQFQQQSQMNYFDTPQAKSFMEMIRMQGERQGNNLMNAAANSQMTDEAKLAGMDSINRNQGQMMGQLAGQGDNFKQNAQRNQLFSLQGLMGMNAQEQQRRMNSLQNIVGPASDAVGNYLFADALGGNLGSMKQPGTAQQQGQPNPFSELSGLFPQHQGRQIKKGVRSW